MSGSEGTARSGSGNAVTQGVPDSTAQRAARANSFDGIRIVAALAVLVGHAFILTGVHPVPSVCGIPIDTLAVSVFFVVSGYLIAGSWERLQNWRRFTQHRVLRIFPALWVVVIVTTFVIGPLSSTQSVGRYFSSGQTWTYLVNLSTDAQYLLPGVFDSRVHARNAVNGSLWTLGVEVSCYFVVLVVGLLLRRRKYVGFSVMAVAGLTMYFLASGDPQLRGLVDAGPVVVFFAFGALLRTALPKRLLKLWFALALLLVWLLCATLLPQFALEFEWLALPYCVLAVATARVPILRSAARFGDLSYGTYLWAFVVQQIALDVLGRIPIGWDILVVGITTLAIAWLSWHLIERPSLSLKDRPLRWARPDPVLLAS